VENKKIAIQDTYEQRFKHCWGCGADNPDGIQLKSYPTEDGEHCIAKYTPADKYTGGVPNNLFGGIMATLFDCHSTASAAWFNLRNKREELTEDTVIERYITARIEVDFVKPVPMNTELTVCSTLEELTDRKAIIRTTLEFDGEVGAKAKVIAVKAKKNM